MSSCEICEIFKSNYFEEHLRTTTSKQKQFLLKLHQIESQKIETYDVNLRRYTCVML